MGFLLFVYVAGTLSWHVKTSIERQILEAVPNQLGPIITSLDFCCNLAVGNIPAAYGHTSEGFQSLYTEPAFAELVEEHPVLTSLFTGMDRIKEQPELQVLLITTDPKAEAPGRYQLILCKERGQWKVDNISFEDP